MKIIIIFFVIMFTNVIYSKELKSLTEIFKKDNTSDYENSIILMQRCAAIYGALYFINPSDVNSQEYENRYKIFLQSAVIEDIKLNNTNEDESYKKQIEEFKSSLKFLIQIFIQNVKKNNSYLKNNWVEKDFEICKKF